MNYLPLILFSVLTNAGAQLLLNEGMNRIGHFELRLGECHARRPQDHGQLVRVVGGWWPTS